MATITTQWSRKPQASSPDVSPDPPAHKPRTIKANSMPIVPSVMHVFGSASPSDTRSMPSPPQHAVLERQMTPPHHHPRPVTHQPLPEFLTKLDVDEKWHMTEVMADIERADQANAHYQRDSPPKQTLPLKDPKARPPLSPTTSSFGDYHPYQTQDQGSPSQIHAARRAISADARTMLLPGQTPPLQLIGVNPRTPDRSLPVQEEQEDDVDASRHYEVRRSQELLTSPTPSSDLNPEGAARYEPRSGRNSRAGHRRDDDDTLIDPSSRSSEDEGSHTPRSTQSGLPLEQAIEPDRYARYNNATIRARTRNGTTDQLGLHTLDPAMFADKVGVATPDLDRVPPPQYVEQRRDQRGHGHEYPPSGYDSRGPGSTQPVFVHPEDLAQYMDHPSFQAYFSSPRPNAPIPPTPPNQTAAPSPSPLRHAISYDDQRKDYPPYSPVLPAGSPYPYPFNHVRRNHSYPYTSRQAPTAAYDANHPAVIQEQLARQWQVYAQNLAGGHVSDSTTFSPASTPFQGYNPWAFLHANRTLGGGLGINGGTARVGADLRSMQSSPSHEPVNARIPASVGLRKKDKDDEQTRMPGLPRRTSLRKPPPRVDSTQPRSTPEPDRDEESSGEETAGEDESQQRYAVADEGSWVGIPVYDPTTDADWVDDDDDGDGEDLLELEFHPTYVGNVEKRRRRWETKWEALVQAFNALDRQTDATLVLLAAPSHSTQLHSLTSRSIKRNPSLGQSPAMKEVRVGFRQMAERRRATRTHQSSLADRFMSSANGSGDGSDAALREEDLKRALGTALGSLSALRGIYDQREARWVEEMRRIRDDRERVELLLRQVLGNAEAHI
ncbi:hypothetical protein MKEN_00789900 [Mycena kentingensis (nom. inval.)]|nr:hypothetical protein MKEN_00789900 [Mycena kentingensis (nom. inval.)]